ncbi:MetQ/NlpA family ABC transporter substrate-binding protein [Erwinia sp. P7711]|uniref:MetQ/NlpA family ABC transporter substrate-binding protein n=1 Tax=Erwinia sp. P7711 TaxID=3141451 RepID=UPI00318A3E5C
MKKQLLPGMVLSLLSSFTLLAAAHADDNKVIRIGFNPGPYKEQFEKGVAPWLIKKGYKIEYKDFSDGIQVNDAVNRGSIEANIMQHPIYLQSVNDRLGIDNVGIVQVPTPPMGLYSDKNKTTKPAPGATVSVPNQASNEYRAALLLQSIGWIKISPKSDPATFSQKNVTENPYKIVLKEMDNAQQVRALPDVDYGVIQGNFAVSSGMKLNSALKLEDPTSNFINIVTVAGKNREAPFAKDIIAGYHSAEFKQYIQSHAEYQGYLLPDYFK